MSQLNVPSWDEFFLRMMYLVASKSKDQRTQVGAVLVKNKAVFATGYNGISPGVREDIAERHIKPLKSYFYEHAERNSIYFCAQQGISTMGAIMYTNGVPCADCARAIVRAGIKEVVTHKAVTGEFKTWKESIEIGGLILKEARVKHREVEIFLGVKNLHNGLVETV